MKFEKKVVSNLHLCYSLAELEYHGQHCFLVGAEKHDPCYLFNEDGEQIDTVWEGPGGVMTMLQVPGSDGQFLSTHEFYSPNDGKAARIIIATPMPDGEWEVRTLCDAPFVHRFGILERNGVHYLIVCCLKSDMEYKNDWRFPGACYGAVLPDDLSSFDADHQLELKLLKDGMLRNHGYSLIRENGYDEAVVGCEEGTFRIAPPADENGEWEFTNILPVPSSDSVLTDLDGDGIDELGTFAPFHGNSLSIYHQDEYGNYVPQWKYSAPEAETEMLHATWACELCGKKTWVVGWRKGTKDTIAITWDPEAGNYKTEYIDRDTGCANIMYFKNSAGKEFLIATNREIDEVAMYSVEES